MDYDKKSTTTEERDVVSQDGDARRHTVVTSGSTTLDSRVVASRVVWYIAGFIITLLIFRIILFMLGANQGSPFVDFIYALSGIFAAPFTGIFPTPANGVFAFDTASVLAIIVYAVAAWGVSKLLTLNRPDGTADV